MKKSELLKEYEELKAKELQRKNERTKPFRIFQGLEDWIQVIEWYGKESMVITEYKFDWYSREMWPVFIKIKTHTYRK